LTKHGVAFYDSNKLIRRRRRGRLLPSPQRLWRDEMADWQRASAVAPSVCVFSVFRGFRFSIIFPGIREIQEICTPKPFGGGQILKTPMVIKPSNQPKPALSLM